MDFDKTPPVPVADYRTFQNIVPGIAALYENIDAILRHSLPDHAEILVVGAGGGRELETLLASPGAFSLTGVDPSQAMLDLARDHLPAGSADRVSLIKGYVDDVPADRQFAAATSVLVMHFLPDDGAKAAYLSAIRARLPAGAPYIHVDVSIESDLEADNIAPVFRQRGAILGLPEDVATRPADFARAMRSPIEKRVVDPARNRTLLHDAGFEVISPFFRSLWFTGWWARAV
ncbi:MULTISPECIES: class I SAM-dependent methyltransferase [unclassified Sphingomonas]|uniref:class I SAM-dependent methyltransferase n=1 Tax=unclassified Sphingomonas TaxID=196159 RepID=UPI0006F3F7DE|nr:MULTISPECIES: class I SAM-dependent methyltransferase [unclassified Sphingomonas]KQX23421.1 hypothetical protein ASD17_03720 [Sphingomonas sp. Root1294]KQY68272.1 hypothetical protein ASD39_06240 [Sphingomonas sp. Root50]KRB91171.1 hypothetical protein ASE22_13045 [Sphingomonas sp. Root720]